MLEVTLEGDPDPVTGMVFDLRELKEILNAEVVDPMDHRFLNHEVPPFDRIVPDHRKYQPWKSGAAWIAAIRGPGAGLKNVRLYETADLYVDYAGRYDETDPPLSFLRIAPSGLAGAQPRGESAALREVQQPASGTGTIMFWM